MQALIRERPLEGQWLDFPPLTRLHRGRPLDVAPMRDAAESVTSQESSAGADSEPSVLVQRCKRGEAPAFRELYGKYKRSVASQLAFLVPRSDVEDVLQDVFVEVFRSIRRFEGRSAFSTWLYRLVVHVAMKARRRGGRTRLETQAEAPETADVAAGPHDVALTRERMTRAEALLEALSAKKRTVLVLHDIKGMDAARIAELTGSNIMTVRTRLFYARREFEKLASADPALADFFRTAEALP
jgi:RNA polymerase sigma-70 factor (ECF subfamily)